MPTMLLRRSKKLSKSGIQKNSYFYSPKVNSIRPHVGQWNELLTYGIRYASLRCRHTCQSTKEKSKCVLHESESIWQSMSRYERDIRRSFRAPLAMLQS